MATGTGPTLEQRIAAHPIRKAPDNKIHYVRRDGNRVPLYAVETPSGERLPPRRADHALAEAARRWTVHCYYHGAACPDNRNAPLKDKRQRDHVLPVTRGGPNHLHNLVLCCEHYNSRKSDAHLCEIDPASGQRYLEQLSRHISDVMGSL